MKSRKMLLGATMMVVVGLAGFMGCSSETEATNTVVKLPTVQCGACEHAVSTALKAVEGVQDVKVDLKTKTADVSFVANLATVAKIEDAVVKAGYAANDKKADAKAYEQLPECCKVGGH